MTLTLTLPLSLTVGLHHQMTTPLVNLIYPLEIRTYVKEEVVESGAAGKKSPDDVEALMVSWT